MTVKRCSQLINGTIGNRCPADAEWTAPEPGGLRQLICEKHLPQFERDNPDAMILPLDTENH